MIDIEQKKTYKETLEILKGLNLIEEVPKEVINMFEENKDENWEFKFDENVPLEEQKILKNTTKLLSILYMSYICKDENEKEELIKIYKQTQEKKDKESMENLFKNNTQYKHNATNIEINESNKLPVPKSSKIKQIIEKIKNFFKRFNKK